MCLHEGLWITVITWNCQTSSSGQPRGRSEWISVLHSTFEERQLYCFYVDTVMGTRRDCFKDQLRMSCSQQSGCLYVNDVTLKCLVWMSLLTSLSIFLYFHEGRLAKQRLTSSQQHPNYSKPQMTTSRKSKRFAWVGSSWGSLRFTAGRGV